MSTGTGVVGRTVYEQGEGVADEDIALRPHQVWGLGGGIGIGHGGSSQVFEGGACRYTKVDILDATESTSHATEPTHRHIHYTLQMDLRGCVLREDRISLSDRIAVQRRRVEAGTINCACRALDGNISASKNGGKLEVMREGEALPVHSCALGCSEGIRAR